MITLNKNDKLEFVLAGAADPAPQAFASYEDVYGGLIPGRAFAEANGATDVTLVSAPYDKRVIKSIMIYNADDASVTVTVKINSGGTDYNLITIAVASGKTLQYSPNNGFAVTA